jgi:murein endopeptidase
MPCTSRTARMRKRALQRVGSLLQAPPWSTRTRASLACALACTCLTLWGMWTWTRPGHASPPISAAGAAAQSAALGVEDGRPQELDMEGGPDADLPLVPIPPTGQSVGAPVRGRLRGAVQLPHNDALYTRRTPDHAWGSSFTLNALQRAIAVFRRETRYAGPLVVSDISLRRGGRFRPHGSHQSGRDVDLWLPLADADAPPETVPAKIQDVDWPAAWGLIKVLVASETVDYIFLHRSRQRQLYRVAQAEGTTAEYLEEVLQFPRTARTAIVRHESGHTKHMHIRFRCGDEEPRCR